MTKTEGVDFFLGKIATLTLDIQFDMELAKRHALGAKQVGGGISPLHLEILETKICNIKRDADELLFLFRCLKVAKWNEEQEKEKANDED